VLKLSSESPRFLGHPAAKAVFVPSEASLDATYPVFRVGYLSETPSYPFDSKTPSRFQSFAPGATAFVIRFVYNRTINLLLTYTRAVVST